MQKDKTITINTNGKGIELDISQILYVLMDGNIASIHLSKEEVYSTRITLTELEKKLGDNFIKVKRGCLVSAMAIHSVTDTINLCNGESLLYVIRSKKEILEKLQKRRQTMIRDFNTEDTPNTEEEYHKHYRLFDKLPIAFADIEMVFDDECHAID